MSNGIFNKSWWVDNIVPISMGAILGATVAGTVVHGVVQDCKVFGFTLEAQTWISATLGVIAGALISWLMAWAYAKKAEGDVKAILAEVAKVRNTSGIAGVSTLSLVLGVLASHPKLAKTAGAGVARLWGLLVDTAALPASSNATAPNANPETPQKQP